MSRKPITQNGHSIYRPAAIEVDLQLVCSGSVVYLDLGGSKVIRWGDVSLQRKAKKSYISHIDRSVVCIYPLLGGHIVERS